MADLRLEVSSPLERLSRLIAGQNGLTTEEGREDARSIVRFFSALLDLPTSYAPSAQRIETDLRRSA